MNKEQIIRAWSDADYFFSLSDAEREQLPSNPVGMVELNKEALRDVLGASHSTCYQSCHRSFDGCTNPCDSCFTGSFSCCC